MEIIIGSSVVFAVGAAVFLFGYLLAFAFLWGLAKVIQISEESDE